MAVIDDIDATLSITKLDQLFASRPFEYNVLGVISEAALTFALIHLKDLLVKANSIGHRVAITDNVDPVGKERDLTSLICACRNAACHIGSETFTVGTNQFAMNWFYGKAGCMIDDRFIGSEFDDDIAVTFGEARLYIRRNLFVAFDEVRKMFG